MDEFRSYGISSSVYARLARGSRLSVSDLVHLVERRVSEDLIIRHLEESGEIYRLSTPELKRLARAGAGDDLLEFMGGERRRYAGPPVYYEYDPYHDPYFYDYYPGPSVGVYYHEGYSRGYHHRGHNHSHDRPRYPHERIKDRLDRIF